MFYVDVILPVAFSGQFFTYSCPDTFATPKIGARVSVPISSKIKIAVIVSITTTPPTFKTRPIIEILDQSPIFTQQQIDLMRWISDYYICPLGLVLKNTMPTAIRSATYTPATRTAYSLCSDKNLELIGELTAKRKAAKNALNVFLKFQHEDGASTIVSKKMLLESGATETGLKFLATQAILIPTVIEARRYSAIEHVAPRYITPKTQEIADTAAPTLLFNTGAPNLLTDIVCGLIEQVALHGKTALIVTPDTFSAMNYADRLSENFEVVEYHPRIAQSKRNEAYMRVANHPNSLDVIVGTRAAALLPMHNLGLVVVVQESDYGHKSDQTPVANSRDVALVLANQHSAKCVLTTGAPSMEAFTMCQTKRWQMVRIDDANKTASVKLLEKGKKILFSKYMLNRISETLEAQEQVIVFQNRRGFASSIICDDCGYIPTCERCNVMLTLHNSDLTMRCHYCGYKIAAPKLCPGCSSTNIKAQGMGTERVVEELAELFPSARIARIDSDSVARRDAFGEMTRDIEDAKADIIVGTQLILRGLRPSKATLAIVINADNMFLSTDFRTSERAIASLVRLRSMVSGGELIIQSSNTKNPTLKALEWNQVSEYYKHELTERKELSYPPFVRLILLRLYCADRKQLLMAATTLDNRLSAKFGNRISPPYEPAIDKIQNRYILEMMLRLERNTSVQDNKQILKEITDIFRRDFSGVDLSIDVDPI